MTPFLTLAALLVAVVLVSLLLPLLVRTRGRSRASVAASNAAIYVEQLADLDAELSAGTISREQWEASRTEIQRRALEEEARPEAARPGRSIVAAVAIAIAIPALAIGLYAWRGNPQALSPQASAAKDQAHAITPDQIQGMITRLAARLESSPDDAEGWVMLARSYGALGRFSESASAFAKAAKLRPDDAQLLADYADSLAMANNRSLAGEPTAIIERALKADGKNAKALALAGTAAFDRRDYRGAVGYWQKLLEQVPAESEFGQSIRTAIADAERNLSGGASSAPAPLAGREAAKAGGSSLQGKISLAPAVASTAKPDDAVFIFARPAEGSRAPLAIMRVQVKDLPFDFSLDDSMAMDPSMKLSGFPRLVVVARLSKSGSATLQKGDIETVSKPISPGTKGIRIEITPAKG
ncbi:MAG: c-type cytochrome biogenesis protein CcmI [Betaproteobacteria bacterium]|nr:c-type cytochrome biogenesis protein CcmI [Betaproteobacteria bacterium]